ncbi:uncharacterized protein [Physcomitrium patens]|uniref:EGF-like domain-containing protein n=1 Tax=Physcomitrium patens TaxID=3218 RepID=A0A7I4DG77_PHYPA|nr:uncharacterized protein LOC112280164 isoform X1 [Physcomitrium patens]XP_024371081.1 uncharacterized protein LOC112280164 isoform X1 [Physcomitrium patens]|eukprot:XP_024371079.1 uncharacterized protein LOC112280164 isoform X1 [Physcomitrella patens]
MGKRSIILTVLLLFLASAVVSAQRLEANEEISFLGKLFSNDSACKDVDCQQGICYPNDNALLSILFPYKCQCYQGWATYGQLVGFSDIPSLPCSVPNCSLNLDCAAKSPAPAPSTITPVTSANTSACLVPGICGHGKCEVINTKDRLFPTFKCVCDLGYANVLNMTAGFCVSDCEINGDCKNLNITLPGLNPPPPPNTPMTPADQTGNAGTRPESSPPRASESVQGGSSPSSSSGRSVKVNTIGFHIAAALLVERALLSKLF